MKRFSVLFICMLIMFSLLLTGCKDENSIIIEDARGTIEDYWRNLYEEDDIGNGYFEIKNTRVIYIKENDIEQFKDVKYIIEFDIYTDYFGTAPYYSNVHMYNNVAVNKDGSMSVCSRLIEMYRNTTFDTDYSAFIDEIIDYKSEYNCIKDLEK